jgi:hypothetical protein
MPLQPFFFNESVLSGVTEVKKMVLMCIWWLQAVAAFFTFSILTT